jgi:uncharacterized protein (DUF983 family)
MTEPMYDYGDMLRGRITAYRERCPKCHLMQEWNDEEKYCEHCGHDYGRDWETIEVDLMTGVNLRTVVSPQPLIGKEPAP